MFNTPVWHQVIELRTPFTYIPMSARRTLFEPDPDAQDPYKELKESFNSVFDSCMPDHNDGVAYGILLDAMVSMCSTDCGKTSLLKNELDNMFRNRSDSSRITRQEFLKSLKTNTERLVDSKFHILKPAEVLSDKVDSERSSPTASSCREINRNLTKISIMKDRKIIRMKREIENLKREINECQKNEDKMKITCIKKLKALKEELKNTKENYIICSDKANFLEGVEQELSERIQQNEKLRQQVDVLEKENSVVINRISSLEELLKCLNIEKEELEINLKGERALTEMLRAEKLELQDNLVRVSVSKCPNILEYVFGEQTSPERMLIPYPERERGMSIYEELSLLPQSSFKVREDKSTSCSDLVADIKIATLNMMSTCSDANPPKEKSIASKGTQVERSHMDSTSSLYFETNSFDSSSSLFSFVHIMILLICALVFSIVVLCFDDSISLDCTGIANFIRTSVEVRYPRRPQPH